MHGAPFFLRPFYISCTLHLMYHFSLYGMHDRLLENGCSEAEIHLATVQAATTRKERMDTIQEIKQKIRALVEKTQKEDVDQQQQQEQQRYVTSPVPTAANRSPGLTPSPIISRKSPMMRRTTMVSEPSPATRLAHLRFPTSPEQQGFLSPQCHIRRRKRTVPIDLGNDLFSMDSVVYEPFDDRVARICSPKHQACSSPRSFLSAQQYIPTTTRRDVSPMVDTQPPIQPRRLASPVGDLLYSPRQPATSSCPLSAPPPSGSSYSWSSSTRMPSSTRPRTLPTKTAASPAPMQPRRFSSTAGAPVVLFQPPTPPTAMQYRR